MTPGAAAAVETMHAFCAHGGRLSAAALAFPMADQPWIDLSTGINPLCWPVPDLAHALWAALPDSAALAELEAAAARSFGLGDAGAIVAVPGSETALRLLAGLRGKGRVAIVSPTYASHAASWAAHEVQALDWGAVQRAIDDFDSVVLVRPNNPDGCVIAAADLMEAAARLGRRGGWLVVDEAFADADAEDSLLGAWRGRLPDNVVLLRSFGKFFGLAGVRLGFMIGDAALCGRMRDLLGDWPVSGPAIAIGTAAYRDTAWQAATRARLDDAAARLDRMLGIYGLEVLGGTPLFRLVGHPRAVDLFGHLAHRGILARPFADQPDRLRFGLPGAKDQWQRLDTALAAWEQRP